MPQLVKAWSAVGLDGSLLILCLISGVLAMYRGMTREVLTLANWVIAGGAAYLMFLQRAWAEDLGQKYGQNPVLMQIGLTALVFLLTLIVIYVLTGRFADRGPCALAVGRSAGVFGRLESSSRRWADRHLPR